MEPESSFLTLLSAIRGSVVDFEFSTEQEMLRESVRAFLAVNAPTTYVRRVYEDPVRADHYGDDDVWKGLADLGVLGLLVPEEDGGAGMGMVDAAVVLEELGRVVCPAPYTSSAIGAMPLLVDLGATDALSGLVRGEIIGTLAAFEPGSRYQWRRPATTARPGVGGWLLDGAKAHVPDGALDGVRALVTATDPDGVLGVFAVDGTARATETATVDVSHKSAELELTETMASRLGGDATVAVGRALDRLGVAYVVDGVGAAQRALELTVEYAKEREQFGKPIGTFQAVQHLCADMLRTVELGRAAAYYACWAIDDASPEEAHRAATLAIAFVADVFPQLGGTAIQVFGGIGFTWEHDIHLYYKRLLTLSVALGTPADHLEELATIAIP